MDFFKRLRFYLFGILLGILLVSITFRGRGCKTPGGIKLNELKAQELVYTTHAKCSMQCRNISEEEVKQSLISGSINYGKSDVQNKTCPSYSVENETTDGQKIRIIFADCDSTTKVITAIDLALENDTCRCK